MPYPPFKLQSYPFRGPDQDQIASSRFRRVYNGPGVPSSSLEPEAVKPTSPDATPPQPADPEIQSTPTQSTPSKFVTRKCITAAKTTITNYLSLAYDATVSNMKAIKLFRPLFTPDPLGDPDSDIAHLLHAHWDENAPPYPRQSWTYDASARKPSTYHVIAARRPFADDTTGRPIWELEAEAAEKQGR